MGVDRSSIIWRLNCAQGHLSAVLKLVESGYDCEEVLMQLSAVKGALDAAALRLICEQVERSKAAIRWESAPERRCEEMKRLVKLYELWNM